MGTRLQSLQLLLMIILLLLLLLLLYCYTDRRKSFQINSKRRRAESFQLSLLPMGTIYNYVQIITLLFTFTVQKYNYILL